MPETSSIKKLYEAGEKAKTALANLRKKEKESTSELVLRLGTSASVIAGSAIAGAIDGKWGHDTPATESEKYGIAHAGPIPINVGLGIVGVVVGVAGVIPGSEYVATAGASLLGYPIGKMIEAKFSTPKEEKK
jgi:hypothetical protein